MLKKEGKEGCVLYRTGDGRDFSAWAEAVSSSTASCTVLCFLTASGLVVSAVQAGPGAAVSPAWPLLSVRVGGHELYTEPCTRLWGWICLFLAKFGRDGKINYF